MSTPEDKIVTDVKADAQKVVTWYREYPFYAGIIVGIIVTLLVRHFI